MQTLANPYFVCARDLGHGDALMERYTEPDEDIADEDIADQDMQGLEDEAEDAVEGAVEDAVEDADEVTEFKYGFEYMISVVAWESSLNRNPWAGFKQIHRILQEIQDLFSSESMQNNDFEDIETKHDALGIELNDCAPRIFLQCMQLRSPEAANQWPLIEWRFDCFRNGLNMTSLDKTHRISFNWHPVLEYEDEDGVVRFQKITVLYTGPFEMEQVEYSI